ncbi:MAG: PilZ domain-containing protein [Acidiferrobacterales bacterium]
MERSFAIRKRDIAAGILPDRPWTHPEATAAVSVWPGKPAAPRRGYRTSLRKQIPFDTLVNCGLTYSVPWNIINLGLGGALVGMDRTVLHIGTAVEFQLRFLHLGRRIEHCIPARVIRMESRGIALQFGDYDDAVYTDLTNFLYAIEG